MRAHLRYLSYLLRHKGYVLIECCRIGLPLWVGILHDWSKFLPDEWGSYAAYFYGGWRNHPGEQIIAERNRRKAAFDVAWNHHQKRNPHHWQYWHLIPDQDPWASLEMPDRYRKEMVADWRGAGRALGKTDTRGWYLKNREKIVLHPRTREWVEEELGIPTTDPQSSFRPIRVGDFPRCP